MKTKKTKVALNMSKMSVPAIINKCRFIITCLTGNTNFPSPNPVLAAVTQAINDLEAAWNAAADGGKLKTAAMHDKKDLLLAKMDLLGSYVEVTAANDVSKINSSGFDVKQSGGNFVAEGLTLQLGKQSGELIAKVKFKSYTIFHWQFSEDPVPANGFTDHSITTRSRVIIGGLTPGKKYLVRVRLMDKDGAHPFSDAVAIIVV